MKILIFIFGLEHYFPTVETGETIIGDPVPCVDIAAAWRESIIDRQMPVAENEIIEMLSLQHFPAKTDDLFFFRSPECIGFDFAVFQTGMRRPFPRNQDSDIRM